MVRRICESKIRESAKLRSEDRLFLMKYGFNPANYAFENIPKVLVSRLRSMTEPSIGVRLRQALDI